MFTPPFSSCRHASFQELGLSLENDVIYGILRRHITSVQCVSKVLLNLRFMVTFVSVTLVFLKVFLKVVLSSKKVFKDNLFLDELQPHFPTL